MDILIPNIFVKNISETVEYYQKLGFELTMNVPDQGEFVWVMISKGNVSFMFQTFGSLGEELPEIKRENGGSLLLYIRIKEISSYYEEVKNKVKILKGLEKTFYGATEFSVIDNNGYVLTFAEQEV